MDAMRMYVRRDADGRPEHLEVHYCHPSVTAQEITTHRDRHSTAPLTLDEAKARVRRITRAQAVEEYGRAWHAEVKRAADGIAHRAESTMWAGGCS